MHDTTPTPDDVCRQLEQVEAAFADLERERDILRLALEDQVRLHEKAMEREAALRSDFARQGEVMTNDKNPGLMEAAVALVQTLSEPKRGFSSNNTAVVGSEQLRALMDAVSRAKAEPAGDLERAAREMRSVIELRWDDVEPIINADDVARWDATLASQPEQAQPSPAVVVPDPEPGDEIKAWLEKATKHDDSESDDYPDEWFRVEGRAIDEAVEIMRRYRDLAWTAERSREEASKQRDEALQRVRELEASGNTPGDMQLANDRVKVLEDEVDELRQRADERPALRELREWLVAAWSELIEAKKKHDPGSELRVIAQAQANDIQGVIAKVDELLAKQEAGDG